MIDTNGDIDSIPEFTASAALTDLRHKQMELNWSAAELQNKVGQRNIQVISIQAELATVHKQIDAEAEHVLGNMENAYDIAVRREQTLEANLQSVTANQNSEAYTKLQQLRHLADADRKDYESYLVQYNDVSERRELQNAGVARIISPASLPKEPSTNRMKFYALGGMAGLGGGFLLAFLLEYFRPGIKTSAEIEQTFRLPVVGTIPMVSRRKTRDISYYRPLDRMVHEPLSQLSETVRAMRISLELSSANPKVILITSALPGEGKSTAAMLLAASSASSGKRTILLDCDLRQRSTSEALRRLQSKHRPGLSELLRGTAKLEDVIAEDPVTKIYVIPAGSMAPNAADLLMSQEMLDLIAVLRGEFRLCRDGCTAFAAGGGCARARDRRRQDFGGRRVVPARRARASMRPSGFWGKRRIASPASSSTRSNSIGCRDMAATTTAPLASISPTHETRLTGRMFAAIHRPASGFVDGKIGHFMKLVQMQHRNLSRESRAALTFISSLSTKPSGPAGEFLGGVGRGVSRPPTTHSAAPSRRDVTFLPAQIQGRRFHLSWISDVRPSLCRARRWQRT